MTTMVETSEMIKVETNKGTLYTFPKRDDVILYCDKHNINLYLVTHPHNSTIYNVEKEEKYFEDLIEPSIINISVDNLDELEELIDLEHEFLEDRGVEEECHTRLDQIYETMLHIANYMKKGSGMDFRIDLRYQTFTLTRSDSNFYFDDEVESFLAFKID